MTPIFALLQTVAGERIDPNNHRRMKEKSARSMLQDVAVNGSDVEIEHAPNFGALVGFEPVSCVKADPE